MQTGFSPLLEIRDLSIAYRSYGEPVQAVRNVSLQVRASETVSLVGESGSGKSTVALAVLGLLPGCGLSGEILYQGRDMKSFTESEWTGIRSREIGIVFQDARSALNPVMTILHHLTETLRAHQPFSRKESRTRASEILREVGIPEGREKLYPFEFSGGMCQRAGIALGICNRPQLLIADEPTSAIDSAIQAQILDLLKRMKEHYRLALLLISHDLPLVAQVSDRIAVMYHGRVVESGLKEEILTAPAHPYTQSLLQCQPSFQSHHEKNPLTAIPGAVPRAEQEFPGCPFAPRCSRSESRCWKTIPPAREISSAHLVECILDTNRMQDGSCS
jgi:oligopeptide/dipeptide ABC transporter ATP-binding protein